MSKQSIMKVSESLNEIGEVIEEEFGKWSSPDCMPYQKLFDSLTEKLSWTEEDLKKNDPVVRWYIFKHDEWTSVRGAKGGCQRISVLNSKKAFTLAREDIKKEVQAKIDAAIAASSVETDIDDSESDF